MLSRTLRVTRAAEKSNVVVAVPADLGSQHVPVAVDAAQRLAEHGLGGGEPVVRGDIEEVDSRVERGMDGGDAVLLGEGAVDAAERRGAEAEFGDRRAAAAQRPVSHGAAACSRVSPAAAVRRVRRGAAAAGRLGQPGSSRTASRMTGAGSAGQAEWSAGSGSRRAAARSARARRRRPPCRRRRARCGRSHTGRRSRSRPGTRCIAPPRWCARRTHPPARSPCGPDRGRD